MFHKTFQDCRPEMFFSLYVYIVSHNDIMCQGDINK